MLVRLEQIGKRCGETAILSDVSLSLEAGGFYCLTGDSGAGKSTLLRIIHMAELPSSGRALLFGSDAAAISRAARAALRRRIGVVFQDLQLVAEWSAAENAALPLRVAGVPESRIRADIHELLDWLGLAARNDVPAGAMSDGERRRLALGRAVVGRPELLLLDEPAGGADDALPVLVRVLKELHRLGTTILLATRDPRLAARFEHRPIRLERGRLLMEAAAAAQ